MMSLIIPVYNDGTHLEKLFLRISQARDKDRLLHEVIVVDGGSEDHSLEVANRFSARVVQSAKGRAVQMNMGARFASGKILQFIHADALPPLSFLLDIENAVGKGESCGCFRSLFDTRSRMLKACSYFTRFNGIVFRGGGQTLWVLRELFEEVGGYDERMSLMEEYDLIQRLSKKQYFHIIQKDVVVSARDYDRYGNWRLQSLYGVVYLLYFSGASQETIKRFVYGTIKKGNC